MYVVKKTGALKQKPTRSGVGCVIKEVLSMKTIRNIADLKGAVNVYNR